MFSTLVRKAMTSQSRHIHYRMSFVFQVNEISHAKQGKTGSKHSKTRKMSSGWKSQDKGSHVFEREDDERIELSCTLVPSMSMLYVLLDK